MTRLTFLASTTALAVIGCKDVPANGKPGLDALVSAGDGIALKTVRTYATSDAVAGSSDVYYIVSFDYTNGGTPLVPRIDHFVLEDDQKRRFLGADSGNANLIGLSNPAGVLKAGDARTYTVGFRVPQNTHAKLFYDGTF